MLPLLVFLPSTMRSLFIASLVVAGIFASSAHGSHYRDSDALRRRKTLGFGPEHPHKVFRSTPYQIQLNAGFLSEPRSDPFDVAVRFVENQTGSKSFYIRKDSYTDRNTGVTHVYVRQTINGLEVTDGDMNINVKDGIVLSFGNSVRLSLSFSLLLIKLNTILVLQRHYSCFL